MTVLAAFIITQAAPPLADLPFDYEPGRIWLKATINGVPVRTLLDTGANASYADQALASLPGVSKIGDTKTSSTSGDGTRTAAVRGMTLAFEGTSVKQDIPFALRLPDSTTKGPWAALGIDFIKRYVVDIDYQAKRLRLYAPEGFEAPKDHIPMRLTLLGGYATFRGNVQLPGMEQRKLNILFDTGSPLGMILTNRLVREDHLEDKFPSASKIDFPGPFGSSQVAVVKNAIGGFSTATFNAEVGIALSPEGVWGKDAAFDALMGDQIFSKMHVVLDYSRLRMYLRKV